MKVSLNISKEILILTFCLKFMIVALHLPVRATWGLIVAPSIFLFKAMSDLGQLGTLFQNYSRICTSQTPEIRHEFMHPLYRR